MPHRQLERLETLGVYGPGGVVLGSDLLYSYLTIIFVLRCSTYGRINFFQGRES